MMIAQIACHNDELPQGSPCSPIISNSIASSLDKKLIKLSKKYKFTYTRYADDITISTNLKNFPEQIAEKNYNDKWQLGNEITQCVENSGFTVNTNKVRMQYKTSKQVVTGIVVNKKVNTSLKYYRYARAMCNSLFMTGEYNKPGNDKKTSNINILQGILSYIYYIKNYNNNVTKKQKEYERERKNVYSNIKNEHPFEKNKSKEHVGIANLYSKFLFFKYFINDPRPIIYMQEKIYCTYLKHALKKFSNHFPNIYNNIFFISHGKEVSKLIPWFNDIKKINDFIYKYNKMINQFHVKSEKPVIIIINNDLYSRELIEENKKIYNPTFHNGYYQITKNLFLIIIPKTQNIKNDDFIIEDYFSEKLLSCEINGKAFDKTNEYERQVFANKVILPNANKMTFSNFLPLLKIINNIISLRKNNHKLINLVHNNKIIKIIFK